jgi:MFS family permease
MYGCLFLGAVARAVSMPANSAFMPQLVPADVFSNAVTWSSMRFQLASTVGPAVGGLVLAASGHPAVVYILDALMTLTFVVCLLLVHIRSVERKRSATDLRTLLAGVRFVWNTKLILAAITLDMFAVLLGGAVTLLPIYAKDILHVGPSGLGWLRAAPAVGALLMGAVMAHRPPLERAGSTLLYAVFGFGVATVVFGFSHSFILAMAMLFLTGAFDNISVVIRHTLVQTATPDALRGRVSSVNGLFISCSNELGGFESGLAAQLFGPVVSVVGGGIGTLLVVGGVAALWPQLRRLGPLQEASTPVTAEEEAEHLGGG